MDRGAVAEAARGAAQGLIQGLIHSMRNVRHVTVDTAVAAPVTAFPKRHFPVIHRQQPGAMSDIFRAIFQSQ